MDWLNLLFPKTCAACGSWQGYLCPNCLEKIKAIAEPICPHCLLKSYQGFTHPRCLKPWGLMGLTSALAYQGITERLIWRYKYAFVTVLTPILGELLISLADFSPLSSKSWLLIPVPLHRRKYNWRGFNQAELLGRYLAAYLHWPFLPDGLIRHRQTKSQINLGKIERLENVRGAFKVKYPHFIKNQSICLIDDVWTSGSTMRESAKVLKRAGAASVWGLTLARAV